MNQFDPLHIPTSICFSTPERNSTKAVVNLLEVCTKAFNYLFKNKTTLFAVSTCARGEKQFLHLLLTGNAMKWYQKHIEKKSEALEKLSQLWNRIIRITAQNDFPLSLQSFIPETRFRRTPYSAALGKVHNLMTKYWSQAPLHCRTEGKKWSTSEKQPEAVTGHASLLFAPLLQQWNTSKCTLRYITLFKLWKKPDFVVQISLSTTFTIEISLLMGWTMAFKPFMDAESNLSTTVIGIFALEIRQILATAGGVTH